MINDLATKNIGEKLTFFQLFTEKKWRIEVPIIQRDYAQGRESAKEIRDAFLSSLIEHLNSGENIDLDFVYGSVSETAHATFIPLDGQQRLTTLFLLHWYLGHLEGQKVTLDSFLLDGKKSKFSYKTRTSSSEFCDALLYYGLDLNALLPNDEGRNNSLSKTIEDSEWYFSTWKSDPTIQAMLTMLDAICNKFNRTKGNFGKLINTENPIITFQFLNLQEFKLTDDLYIKMNARGKQLSPFENFKANLEQHITSHKIPLKSNHKLVSGTGEAAVSVKEYFSHKIDTDWANLFWKFRNTKDNTYDAQLMNFIRVVVTNYFALNATIDDLIYLRFLIGKEDANEKNKEANPISYTAYKVLGCLKPDAILSLIAVLDLIEEDEELKFYLPNNTCYNEREIFNDVIKNQLNYTERLQFYAFYQYLVENGSADGLEDWIRVIHNLTENSIYNNAEQFARSLKSIQTLLPHSANIIEYISDATKPVSGFVEIQIMEERIKANLLKKSDVWSNAVLKIERHGYLKGQIGFILNFSGIESYYTQAKNCDWPALDDTAYLGLFQEYARKANAIFVKSGLRTIPEPVDDDFLTWTRQHLWERALLTKGDYLLQANSNRSFLIDRDRDISWKSLLRDNNLNEKLESRRVAVKMVFDDEYFDTSNVQSSLEQIIASSNVQDWRKYFIEEKGIMPYLGSKRYIRWESENSIYLLQKMRMSGPHAEYYSFAFYQKHLAQKDLAPFSRPEYYSVSGDEDDPCAYMEGWHYNSGTYAIEIYGRPNTMLEISFFNTAKGDISEDIIDVLVKSGFNFNEYWYKLLDFNLAYETVVTLCQQFQKLSE